VTVTGGGWWDVTRSGDQVSPNQTHSRTGMIKI
jgi:hypothetical protein